MIQLPGGWEIILIVIVVAVIFGGEKAVKAMKKAGQEAYKVKKEVDNIKNITKK